MSTFSPREFRNSPRRFASDETATGRQFKFKTDSGVVPECGGKITIDEEGNIVLDKSLNADDVLAFARNWMMSLPNPGHRYALQAVVATNVAIFLMDNRAMERHGYAGKPDEHQFQPSIQRLPSETMWAHVLESAKDRVEHNGFGIAPAVFREISTNPRGFTFTVGGNVYTAQGATSISIMRGVCVAGNSIPADSDEYAALLDVLRGLKV